MTVISQADAVMRAIDEVGANIPAVHPVLRELVERRKAWQHYAHESDDEHVALVKAMGEGIVSSFSIVYRERDRFEREAYEWLPHDDYWRGLDPTGSGHEMFQVKLTDGGWLQCYYVPRGA